MAVSDRVSVVTPDAGIRRTLSWVSTVFGPFLGLVLIIAFFAWLTRSTGSFLKVESWRTIAVQTVVVGTAALGMTAIMISGGIELSVGSTVALVTVAIALLVRWLDPRLPAGVQSAHVLLPAAMMLGVLLGGLCGAINGTLIAALGVVPFIVTLGSYKVFRRLAKWLGSNNVVYIPDGTRGWWFSRILAAEPQPRWLLVAPGVWILLALSLALALTLRYSLLGVTSMQSDRTRRPRDSAASTCRLSRSWSTPWAVWRRAWPAGFSSFSSMGPTGDPTTADGLELQVIAAVVIGGGSLSGGEGTVLGTLIGCLIMSVLNNGCTHAGIPNATQDVFIGIIIVAAVTIDQLRRRQGTS